jgi:hypothetical protein
MVVGVFLFTIGALFAHFSWDAGCG